MPVLSWRRSSRDEQQVEAQAVIGDYVAARITLGDPSLWVYEMTNAIWQATRQEASRTSNWAISLEVPKMGKNLGYGGP